ncbi:rubrerythrin-like domain-containing protein [Halocatena marina]|uniref:Rubrerythrin-like domain-containing protein n=1 Tax=Halocatena marina TaxID=2934937 RepID=A0ABD5YLB0_9EURY|nr:rubrerythrin-like domain-containing protein [Halocatena marina]
MRDVSYDPNSKSAYECFNCGTIVRAESNPGTCDNCGSAMRNRLIPLE